MKFNDILKNKEIGFNLEWEDLEEIEEDFEDFLDRKCTFKITSKDGVEYRFNNWIFNAQEWNVEIIFMHDMYDTFKYRVYEWCIKFTCLLEEAKGHFIPYDSISISHLLTILEEWHMLDYIINLPDNLNPDKIKRI